MKTLSCSSRVVSCAWRRACRCSSSEAAASLAASSVSSLLTSARFSARSASSAETASSPLFSAMLFASDSTCAFSASSRARPSRMALSSSFAPSAKMQSFPNYAYNRISHCEFTGHVRTVRRVSDWLCASFRARVASCTSSLTAFASSRASRTRARTASNS